jgi:hypothetical protein
MKKIILLISFAFIFSSCVKDAKESVQKGDFTVEFLFEQNGCKMYRFSDNGRYIYWADCTSKIQYNYNDQTGKTVITHQVESITTK